MNNILHFEPKQPANTPPDKIVLLEIALKHDDTFTFALHNVNDDRRSLRTLARMLLKIAKHLVYSKIQ